MAIRKVMRLGHPVLRRKARPLRPEEIGGDELRRLVDDMVDTLHEYGGIGLAAPQVAESVRLAIVEIPGGPTRYGELAPVPLGVYINPKVTVLAGPAAGYWEGCLSVPGMRGFVERPQHIRVEYTTLDGEACTAEFEGFPATVFQHEFDHLDGVLYVDRLKRSELFMFEEEFGRYHADRANTLD